MKEKRQTSSILTSPRSHLYSQAVWINALRLVWIVTFVWGEVGVFYWCLRNCLWPVIDGLKSSAEVTSRVLLVSDPQVQHPALQNRGESWSPRFWRVFSDLNLKKSWHVTVQLKPDVIVFLGDMLANGRGAKDKTRYIEAAEKFKSIFSISPDVAVHYVPGNNDIWLGEITSHAKIVRGFYADAFGPPSKTFDVQNHTFVVLDAPGLVDEDYLRSGKGVAVAKWKPLPDGPIAFVKEIANNRENEEAQNPLILLSHIPFARPEMANCGTLREKGTIRRNVGHGYQSMLGRQTTTFLLQTLKPIAVFSGDNRDYCEYSHTIADDTHSIREVTLKSFSPSIHIRKPGFQLLSVTSPASVSSPLQNTIADSPCFLPDQWKIYTSLYAPLTCFTLVFLFLFNLRRSRSRSQSRRPAAIRASSYSSFASSGNVSVQTTPIHQYAPRSASVPSNARGGFPTGLRTPHTARFSRPGTPNQASVSESPFAHAGISFTDEEDDDDPMQPAQYAVKRESRRHYDDHDEEWSDLGQGSSVGGRDVEEPDYDFIGGEAFQTNDGAATVLPPLAESGPPPLRILSQFISAPESIKLSRAPMWSWSFVLAGRMRRITIRRPTVVSLKNFVELLKGTENRRYRGNIIRATITDVFSVFWLPLLVWWLIIQCIS